MGSLTRRGTRDNPKWYVRYKDADGSWKMRLSHQPTRELARKYLAQVEARVAAGKIGIDERTDAPLARGLMETWAKSITNRNAEDDRRRLRKHLLPKFGKRKLADITMAALLDWIDEQRQQVDADGERELAEASIRHNLNLLSRFFSWAVERGHVAVNPVRQIPQGRRPQQAQKRDVPWLDDDSLVRKLMNALPEPVDLMFYLGNRSGLRTGETVALRMSDLGYLADGVIRVRFSYDGPLKEDKRNTGKMKWVPAADDAEAVLGSWLAMRKAAGAGPEDLVFPCDKRDGSWYRKEFVEHCWEKVAPGLGVTLTWYEATRHTFTSRALSGGASLDEVSAALGHSSPVVTKRYYDHFVRRSFSPLVRQGLGIKSEQMEGASVLPLRRKKATQGEGDP
ncbi:MAG: site-specific integrase [Deltaproteobacteria bacterium]|nr:site-specific integrase [Deltaproteobacteria bacterium]